VPLNLPESAASIAARSKADVQRELATSNPFGKNHWLGAIVTAAANRVYDFYLQLKAAIRDNFPDTATGDALRRWAAVWGKQALPATKSSGRAVATGTPGSLIPAGTAMAANGAGVFLSTSAAVISSSTLSLVSLSRVGTTVTAKTTSPHLLADGITVTIALATAPEYNGTFPISVTAVDEFQYEIIGSPADEPATSAMVTAITASVPVESEEFGEAVNLDAGASLKLQSPIIGVADTLTVDFGAVGGGTDAETEDSLRARLLDRIQNPVAHFNVSAIVEKAKEIAGVTRVFVYEITPLVGQVTVYFMRDNDPNPIPTASEVAAVKARILTIKPANTDDADVIVAAPVAVPVNFTFVALSPNTSTMQDAVLANLRQFFDELTEPGVSIGEDAYRSVIFNTVDTVTGAKVSAFTLSAPIGTVAVAAGEIGVLGSVAFP